MAEQTMITRRTWLASLIGTFAGGLALSAVRPVTARAEHAPTPVTVYKDPSCGCCTKWVTHLRANGFAPIANDRSDMDALKDSLGVPVTLRSCHTAVVGRYVIEGHVPAADLKRLLATAPKGVLGLAVPGMPSGSPGMEVSGAADRYDVVSFGAAGATHVFATHGD
jgi:hypothetical protein